MNSQGLKLEQKQRLRLSQQHLKYVKLLELNAPELDEAVERELADNPALEAEEDDLKLSHDSAVEADVQLMREYNYSRDDERVWDYSPVDNTQNLYDFLNSQIAERIVDPQVANMAKYLIGNIDPNGYLRRGLDNIIQDLAFSTGHDVPRQVAENALQLIRSLDPAGVGAANLRDALLLQLDRFPGSQVRDDAINILGHCFEEFTMKHYHRIISILGINRERTRQAVDLILSLNPKPGASYSADAQDAANIIIPDFIVENHDGELFISLNNRLPHLSIEESFAEAVDNLNRKAIDKKSVARNSKKSDGKAFIVSRYNDARDFIRILHQRQQTMMMVMTAITEIQHDYFTSEDVDRMKPMMIKDIAARTGLDISTISRATNNKYVGTPWGVFPLRHFFSDTVGAENEGLTNRKVEAEIERLVREEDKRHPLSDEKICSALKQRGFDVSRRTIAKYRDRKKIPVARLRKEM